MSIEKDFDELERHLSWAQSYYEDIKSAVESELKDLNDEIYGLRAERDTVEEQNTLLEEQVEELRQQNSLLQLELMEVTMELTRVKHELDISR